MVTAHSRIERRLTASRRSGLLRVCFATVALVFCDGVFPGLRSAIWVFAAYLAVSLVFQAMIHRGFAASDLRSLSMGVVDVAVLSYAVYLHGPATSVIPFLYLLIPVVNAASSSSRSKVAMRLAALCSLSYVGLLLAAALHAVPYGPAGPAAELGAPSLSYLVSSGLLVLVSVLGTTNIVLRQMLALERMNRRLAELSNRDELTGLFNRRHLISELRRQIDRVARGASCGVMMIDLDGFKRVNDQRGHDAGDVMLMDIANALTSETRAIDLVARYGGDEFVVLLPDLSPDHAVPTAERIIEAIAKVGGERWRDTPVTASIGLTMAEAGDDVTVLLRRADVEAYRAKRAGGHRLSLTPRPGIAASGVVSSPERRRAGRS
ncbi:MAG TPA: GGDEF domain-containing protein [Polyangiales bacterium]